MINSLGPPRPSRTAHVQLNPAGTKSPGSDTVGGAHCLHLGRPEGPAPSPITAQSAHHLDPGDRQPEGPQRRQERHVYRLYHILTAAAASWQSCAACSTSPSSRIPLFNQSYVLLFFQTYVLLTFIFLPWSTPRKDSFIFHLTRALACHAFFPTISSPHDQASLNLNINTI